MIERKHTFHTVKTLLAHVGLALANRDAGAPFDQKQIGYNKGVLAAKRPPRMHAGCSDS